MSDAPSPDVQHVKLTTSLGDLFFELDGAKAPKTVSNFLHYVDTDYYNGTIFHRVISTFMLQGGGLNENYDRVPPTAKPIKNEADNGLSNAAGTIAMARTGDPDSATSQFFINAVNNRSLDHESKSADGWGYCVFGRVVGGQETLDKIRNAKVKLDPRADRRMPARPLEAIVIQKAERVEAAEVPAD